MNEITALPRSITQGIEKRIESECVKNCNLGNEGRQRHSSVFRFPPFSVFRDEGPWRRVRGRCPAAGHKAAEMILEPGSRARTQAPGLAGRLTGVCSSNGSFVFSPPRSVTIDCDGGTALR